MFLKSLKDQRAKIASDMRALYDLTKSEKRAFSAEETDRWNRMSADEETLAKQIETIEAAETRLTGLEASVRPTLHDVNTGAGAGAADDEKRYASAFGSFLRAGVEGVSVDDKALLRARYRNSDVRAAQNVTTTGGGYLVPTGFSGQLTEAMKQFGGMLQACEVFSTESGNPFPWPTNDDTGNVGEMLGINTAAGSQDLAYGQVMFNAYKFSSKIVLVPIELLQDSFFDVNAHVAKKLGQRIGRIGNQKLTTGTGTNEPMGIVTAATLGKTGATGQTGSIIYDDLVDLEHSVDPAYRATAKFMLHDQSVKVLKKLKDSQGRPLWLPGLSGVDGKFPSTILNYEYQINQDMPQMAASAKSVLFGDLSNYKIRQVLGITLLRLTERYAEFGQVGFIAFARMDGQLVDAGQHPVRFYANSAT